MFAEPLPGANTPVSVDRGKTWEGVRQVSRIVSCPADMELSSAKGGGGYGTAMQESGMIK